MNSLRPRNKPLDQLLAARAAKRLDAVRPQVDAVMAALRATGVAVEVVGSYARGEFGVNSDVDFLVSDTGPLSEAQIFATIADRLKDARFDLVFAAHLSSTSLALMRSDAAARP